MRVEDLWDQNDQNELWILGHEGQGALLQEAEQHVHLALVDPAFCPPCDVPGRLIEVELQLALEKLALTQPKALFATWGHMISAMNKATDKICSLKMRDRGKIVVEQLECDLFCQPCLAPCHSLRDACS